jgi:hypothetical protein
MITIPVACRLNLIRGFLMVVVGWIAVSVPLVGFSQGSSNGAQVVREEGKPQVVWDRKIWDRRRMGFT